MSAAVPDHSLDGESTSELTIGLSASLGLLCLAVVGARLYTRGILLRNAGLDDLFILFTEIAAFGLNVATILEAYWGVGKHSWLTTPEDGRKQLQSLFSAIQMYIWALALVKVSLLLQYRRIFPAAWLQRSSLAIIAFACTWNIVQSVLVTFGCVPMSLLYPPLADRCLDSLTIWYIAAGINITTDFIVFAMPIPLINSLQLPQRQKILLIMVFGLGFFTCIISIVRATNLDSVVTKGDPSWYGASAAIWSMIEVNCAILCACLPTIRHLLALCMPCLGLRSQVSQYLAQQQLSSRSRSRRADSGFVLSRRSRRSQAGPRTPRLGHNNSGNKTIGGSSDREGVMMQQQQPQQQQQQQQYVQQPRHDLKAGLETRWDGGSDFEKPGLYYHSNQISTWISASPGGAGAGGGGAGGGGAGGASAPAGSGKSRRKSEDEGSDVQRLVNDKASEQNLRQHILVTKETVVTEEASEDPRPASGSSELDSLPGRAV